MDRCVVSGVVDIIYGDHLTKATAGTLVHLPAGTPDIPTVLAAVEKCGVTVVPPQHLAPSPA